MAKSDETYRTLREDARALLDVAVHAVRADRAVERALTLEETTLVARGVKGERAVVELDRVDRVFVVGAGKAVAPMARVVERLLGERVAEGLVVTKEGFAKPLTRVAIREASHPTPDERGIAAAREVERIAEAAGENDLLVVLLTGGASALLPAPIEGATLEVKRALTEALQKSGADIRELNAVRKSLSRLKGGGLATIAAPARVLSLVVSDVVGDPIDVIGSGLTAPDTSNGKDALAVLKKYALLDKLPESLRATLEHPQESERADARVDNVIVANNRLALAAMAKEAERLGYETSIQNVPLEGEAKEAARAFIKEAARETKGTYCRIAGGETTVTIRGGGVGGRATEFCLGASATIAALDGALLFCAGTDGDDGSSGATGAVVDSRTSARAKSEGLNPRTFLDENDSASFFRALGDLIVTGATDTNVADVAAFLQRDDAD